MARAKVVHSGDAVQITFEGDRRRPEPSTAIIKFPGGHVEVTRCSDGSYWAHVAVVDGANIAEGRVDRAGRVCSVAEMLDADAINHMAIRVTNTVKHFDSDA